MKKVFWRTDKVLHISILLIIIAFSIFLVIERSLEISKSKDLLGSLDLPGEFITDDIEYDCWDGYSGFVSIHRCETTYKIYYQDTEDKPVWLASQANFEILEKGWSYYYKSTNIAGELELFGDRIASRYKNPFHLQYVKDIAWNKRDYDTSIVMQVFNEHTTNAYDKIPTHVKEKFSGDRVVLMVEDRAESIIDSMKSRDCFIVCGGWFIYIKWGVLVYILVWLLTYLYRWIRYRNTK